MLWVRLAAVTSVAAVLSLAISPSAPATRTPFPLAVTIGAAVGAAGFAAIARCAPRLPPLKPRASVALAKHAVIGLWAANEEVVWRRVLLGELLPLGAAAAIVGSTAAFALAHRRSRVLHLATGGMFGSLYIATGAIEASIAAHWIYNSLVGARAGHAPP